MITRRPSALLANLATLALVAAWAWLYRGPWYPQISPLTGILVLLLASWTRRPWQLWVVTAVLSFGALRRAESYPPWQVTVLALLAAAVILHRLILATEKPATPENEEPLIPSDEADAEREEKIESRTIERVRQDEELARQNDTLQDINSRLRVREELLEEFLQSSQATAPDTAALTAACQRALRVVGAPAEHLALFEQGDQLQLTLVAQVGPEQAPSLPRTWPVNDPLARLMLREGESVVIPDLQNRPDLMPAFGAESGFRTLFAAPLEIEQRPAGIFLAAGRSPFPWSGDQVRLLEWIAGQCGRILETIRWRQTLATRTEQLNDALLAKDDFLARLSHELRTPLTPVLAAAGVLAEDRRLPPDVREDLGMIRNNVTIQSRLIDDLLDLTRLERGTLQLNREDCAVTPLLEDAAAIVASDLDASEQRLTIHSEVPANCLVHGDPARLQQALWNLLQNASKFSPPGSRIHLTARLLDGRSPRVSLVVDDEGPGIAPADFTRVFQAFDQIRKTRQANHPISRGLGLAIAKAVVEQHGGQLTAGANPLGQGARFTIELPAVLAPPAVDGAADGAAALSTPPREPGAKILLVEDHYDTGRVIVRLLKAAGHDVVHAKDATEALRRFSQEKFDLVISDLGLPDESGLVLMARLREMQPGLPGLAMSGYGMESDLQACKEAGFQEHLTKPVEVPRLLDAIKRTLRRADHVSAT